MKLVPTTRWRIEFYHDEKRLVNEALDKFFSRDENTKYKEIKYKLRYDNVVIFTGRELSTVIRALGKQEDERSIVLSESLKTHRDNVLAHTWINEDEPDKEGNI